MDHVRTLDGLRFIAVALVLAAHIPMDGRHAWLVAINEGLPVHPAYIGVDIFFVLSGFLITRILLRDRGAPNAYRGFLARRALRIFPVNVLTLATLAPAVPLNELVRSATYTSNYLFAFDATPSPLRHTWSLCVEEHYYLLWPLVVLFTPHRVSRALCLATPLVAGAAMLAWRALEPEHADELIYRGSLCRSLSLGLGSLLAFYEPVARASRQRLLVLAGLCSASSAGFAWALGSISGVPDAMTRAYATALLSASILFTALACEGKGTITGALLTSAPLVALGRISYGIYLYHYPVFHLADRVTGSLDAVTPWMILWFDLFKCALTLAIAAASYRWVERPLLDLGRRWRTGTRPANAALAVGG